MTTPSLPHFSLFPSPTQAVEGDIFAAEGSKKKTKPKGTKKSKKPKGRSDEDLFGNTDDIFGDLPAAAKTKSPKAKKKKKKVEQSTTAAATTAPEGAAEESKSLSISLVPRPYTGFHPFCLPGVTLWHQGYLSIWTVISFLLLLYSHASGYPFIPLLIAFMLLFSGYSACSLNLLIAAEEDESLSCYLASFNKSLSL